MSLLDDVARYFYLKGQVYTKDEMNAIFPNVATAYKGVATPGGNPGVQTTPCFWTTLQAGTYTNYGGIVVNATSFAVIVWTGTAWAISQVAITADFSAILTQLNALNAVIFAQVDYGVDGSAHTTNSGSSVPYTFMNNEPLTADQTVTRVSFRAINTNNVTIHIIRNMGSGNYKSVASQVLIGVVAGINVFTVSLSGLSGDFVGIAIGTNGVYYDAAAAGKTYLYLSSAVTTTPAAFSSAAGQVGLAYRVIQNPIAQMGVQIAANQTAITANATAITAAQSSIAAINAVLPPSANKTFGTAPFVHTATAGTNISFLPDVALEPGLVQSVSFWATGAGAATIFIARRIGNYFKVIQSQAVTAVIGSNTFNVAWPCTENDYVGFFSAGGGATLGYKASQAGVNYFYATGAISSSLYNSSAKTLNSQVDISCSVRLSISTASKKVSVLRKDGYTAIPADYTNTTNWAIAGGGLQSTAAGVANAILLNKQFNIQYRKTRVKLIMQADTNCALIFKPKEAYAAAGTIVSVDAVALRLRIHEAWSGGTVLPAVRTEVAIPAIVAGRAYYLLLEKQDRTNVLSLIDTFTGVKTTVSTTSTADFLGSGNEVYAGGFGHDVPGFMHLSGTTPTITELQITCDQSKPYTYLAGDSITEGYGVPAANSYAALLVAALPEVSIVRSGRGGGTIDGVIEKITNEAAILQPTYVMVTIGTNGGNSLAKLQTLVDAIYAIGAKPIINCIPAKTGASQQSVNTDILSLGVPSARFDIATSLNNDVTAGPDPAKYIAETPPLHPNTAGMASMFARFLIDVPQIFLP